jgi:hypothetical protein
MIKHPKLLFLLFLPLACCIIYSCKKDEQSSVSSFLTQSTWNLALTQRFKYFNQSLVKTDTVNAGCPLDQKLTFNKDNTFTFTNYNCKTGNLNGKWNFSPDMLYLNTDQVITKNTKGKANPARIINLGQYSLIFDAGDITIYGDTSTTVKKTDTATIYRYGFIHSK